MVKDYLESVIDASVFPSTNKTAAISSTDTSSQFSVDIVEVETISRIPDPGEEITADIETDSEIGLGGHTLEAREIVLNASRLKVESETG